MSETSERRQAAPKKAAAKANQGKPVAYVGPDIPGAKQYTIYNNGLPDALKEKIKEHPVFRSLVIPVGKLAKASAELAREGSALGVIFKEARKKI